MAKENIEDWDQPLPTPPEASEELGDKLTLQELRQINNLKKLKKYVALQTYQPFKPIPATPHTENLAQPKPRTLVENSKQFPQFMVPKERGERLTRLAAKYTTITAEKLEPIIRNQKVKDRQKEDILKRNQLVYYEIVTKLERQCRTQFLNAVINKFANFIAKLATTMYIPPTLEYPYAHIQRSIFCNILLASGVQQTTKEGSEYEVCHKLSHALLSIIIKALDSASTRNPDDTKLIEKEIQNNSRSSRKKTSQINIV